MTELKALLQSISLSEHGSIDVLRLDKVHPITGGNKIFKLKYNLQLAADFPHKTLLTFGGPYSNHIAATALSCKNAGIKCIGVIRGEEPTEWGDTLQFAKGCGMKLVFVSRSDFEKKNKADFLDGLRKDLGDFIVVPEGGANREGVRGCAEILNGLPVYDYVCCACGTGTTYAGLMLTKPENTVLVGISVLRGENRLPHGIAALNVSGTVHGDEALEDDFISKDCILSGYSFSGYAKFDKELIGFKDDFEIRYNIPLDHVYTVKLFFAINDLVAEGKLRAGSKILVIHSGGLQGNSSFERRYQRKLMR